MKNPLVIETLHGLSAAGIAQRIYLGYLVLQASVLFLWWPKSSLLVHINTGDEPTTLGAIIIFTGIGLAYYALRTGAEEVMLPGQNSLREWVLATPLQLGRIVTGYLGAMSLHLVHLLLLSMPIVLAAYAIYGGAISDLAWGIVTIFIQATFYRLLSVCVYLRIGHRDALTFISLRLALLAGYVVTAIAAPMMNHVAISFGLFGVSESFRAGTAVSPAALGFLYGYGALIAVLIPVLYRELSRLRAVAAMRTTDTAYQASPAPVPGLQSPSPPPPGNRKP